MNFHLQGYGNIQQDSETKTLQMFQKIMFRMI